MIRLYVDRREVPLGTGEAGTLGEILSVVENRHLEPDTVIRQIHLDGEPLLADRRPEDLAAILDGVSGVRKVEVFTGSVVDVARDSIQEAAEYLHRVESALPALSVAFRAIPGPEAYDGLRQLYEGFYWLNLLLDRLQRSYGINLATLQVCGATALQHHQNLISLLKEMIAAQERGDFIVLSDLLEYEVQPLISVWSGVFEEIGGRFVRQ